MFSKDKLKGYKCPPGSPFSGMDCKGFTNGHCTVFCKRTFQLSDVVGLDLQELSDNQANVRLATLRLQGGAVKRPNLIQRLINRRLQ